MISPAMPLARKEPQPHPRALFLRQISIGFVFTAAVALLIYTESTSQPSSFQHISIPDRQVQFEATEQLSGSTKGPVVTAVLVSKDDKRVRYLTYNEAQETRRKHTAKTAGNARKVVAMIPKPESNKPAGTVALSASSKISVAESQKSSAKSIQSMIEMRHMKIEQYKAVLVAMGVPAGEVHKLASGAKAEKKCHAKIEDMARAIRDSCSEKVNEDVAIVLVTPEPGSNADQKQSNIAYSCKRDEALHIVTTFDS
eukprot:SAG31_NODE_1364_length_8625_cov_8.137696_1_plen_255_part_00